MLTMSNVSNSAAAGAYYEQANDYYSKDRSPSVWSGQAAAVLGLSGDVKPEDFRAMLDGQLPSGERIHLAGPGRRGGTDMTFSAPKSVSLQALIAGDTKLLQSHETAVARALGYAETLAACRVTVDGVTSRQASGNLVIAQFRHDLSRAADPQLHTHCVVLNATQRADGQWRALDNEPLYRYKMMLGAYYRSELAREVQALGYEVRVTHGDGRFELAHISPEQVKAFSSRSQAIERALEKKGLTREEASARQLQIAALQTRPAKESLDRSAMHAEWCERAAGVGLDFVSHSEPASLRNTSHEAEQASQAVHYAIMHLMERSAVVPRLDIERVALERGVGHTHLEAIRSAIEKAVDQGDLIRHEERYTTPGARRRERDILAMEVAGRGKTAPLMARESVHAVLDGTKLNEDQRGVVAHVLSSKDRIIGVQGGAGTGKTTALRSVRELAEAQGLTLVGVAPSKGAARELAGSGIDSQTLAWHATKNFTGLNARTLVVLDEAGMVSARDMHALLTAADQVGARVVLVGDVQQLKAVEAGKPFAQLQAAGMACAELREIQRQQNPQLKRAVELVAAGNVPASLERLQRCVVEIECHQDRHARIAADFAALTADQRAATLIVASTNLGREAINQEVRYALELDGQGEMLRTLSRKDLTKAQALRTVSYQEGDVLRANRDYRCMGLKRGELARVVDGPEGVVTLERQDGVRVPWHPANQLHMSAFIEYQRELAEGDVLRFTNNDSRSGIVNGERAVVLLVEPAQDRLLVEKSDGTRLALRTQEPLYVEHGYCQTVHAAQGKTCERILIEAPARGAMGNESSYYVAISRATHEAVIYTDDREQLPITFARLDEKSAALDLHHLGIEKHAAPVDQLLVEFD
ncbi:MAG: conjugative relaxase [Candidatus Saccharibacteria bacterium]|nr:conjugative relaxase [Rhodoferax sp.]